MRVGNLIVVPSISQNPALNKWLQRIQALEVEAFRLWRDEPETYTKLFGKRPELVCLAYGLEGKVLVQQLPPPIRDCLAIPQGTTAFIEWLSKDRFLADPTQIIIAINPLGRIVIKSKRGLEPLTLSIHTNFPNLVPQWTAYSCWKVGEDKYWSLTAQPEEEQIQETVQRGIAELMLFDYPYLFNLDCPETIVHAVLSKLLRQTLVDHKGNAIKYLVGLGFPKELLTASIF